MEDNRIIENEILEYLNNAASQVLETLPRPFGTIKKAKYILSSGSNGKEYYQFTTSIHDETECIEILKNRHNKIYKLDKFFRISKVQNGIKKTIYTNYPKWVIPNEQS